MYFLTCQVHFRSWHTVINRHMMVNHDLLSLRRARILRDTYLLNINILGCKPKLFILAILDAPGTGIKKKIVCQGYCRER